MLEAKRPAALDHASPVDKAAFRFTRLVNGDKRRSSRLADVMGGDDLASQCWLFVSPHDDDLCIGAGLLMQAAVQAGVDVQVLIVTDGCLGYCRSEHQDSIVDVRRRETYESFELLGIGPQNVNYIDYPDGGLTAYIGRRRAKPGEPDLAGYVGLQNAFTFYLRKFRPTRVFTPTHTDLHPDHRISHSELMISVFHAAGAIWPELGPPMIEPPRVGELAVYCDFAELPNLEIIGDNGAFDAKLRSIEAYRSQVQIGALVASVRSAGPYEYVRDQEFRLFSSEKYKPLFA